MMKVKLKLIKSLQATRRVSANIPILLLNRRSLRNFILAQNTITAETALNTSSHNAIVLKFTNSPNSVACTSLMARLVNTVRIPNITIDTIENEIITNSFRFQNCVKYAHFSFLTLSISWTKK